MKLISFFDEANEDIADEMVEGTVKMDSYLPVCEKTL